MSLTARLCVALVRLAAAVPLPAAADRAAAGLAIRAIRRYRRHLSHRSGRVCLFHPSCSHRAEALLAGHGWRVGMPLVRDQLRRCGGDYTLIGSGADAVMVTADGRRFPAAELSAYRNPRK